MCRSSTLTLVFLAFYSTVPTQAAVVHTRAVRIDQRPPSRFIGRAGDRSRDRRMFAGGYGFGPFGFEGAGLSAGLAQPPIPAGPILPPQLFRAAPPRPPRCPLIIKIGRGLSHPATSTVVYGHPFCTRRDKSDRMADRRSMTIT